MKIRKATLSDVEKISEIEFKSGYKWSQNKKETINMIKKVFEEKYCEWYILEKIKKSIGYFAISFDKKETICYINYFAIIKIYQGKGFSKLLMKKVINIAKNKNCNKIKLTVWAKNFTAINLYTKFGFHVSGIKKNYYKNGNDKLVMEVEIK